MSTATEIAPDVQELQRHLDESNRQIEHFQRALMEVTGPATGHALQCLGEAVEALHEALWVIAEANGAQQPEQKGK